MSRADSEEGFTLIMTVLAMSAVVLIAAIAVTAVLGDTHLTQHDLERKQAYETARAGIEDYAFHLTADSSYWERCDNVPAPSAVNQAGSTANRRAVPGAAADRYAIELLPAAGQKSFKKCSPTNPGLSMLEAGGPLAGSFRIRANGFAGRAHVSIVATFKRPSFLDYIYFTQYETLDPIAYASPGWLPAAYEQCERTVQEGRYSAPIPGSHGQYCPVISFVGGETIDGPLHTNDSPVICGDPTFGRTAADPIEVSAPAPGWHWGASSALEMARLSPASCPSANPKFAGTLHTNSPSLEPPATNGELATIAEPRFRFTGQVRICLTGGNTMTVGNHGTCTGLYSGPFPSNGVVYVANGACSTAYSPFEVAYPASSGCGTAYVHGSYSGRLTIAAENDIVIDGNLTRSGDGMLGLIANNFVRVYHDYPGEAMNPWTGRYGCNGRREWGLEDLTIDAAILAINHSFIVDHYDCGRYLGTLTVHGAIAQKFRGPVGTFSGSTPLTGYTKSYEYDDRLRYTEPPSFLDPVTKSWTIGRETVD